MKLIYLKKQLLKEQIWEDLKEEKINEEQKFDFERQKPLILKFIQKIKKGEKVTDFDNPFYKIVVGDVGGSLGSHANIGFTKEQNNQWKQYFSSNVFDTDGVWSQRNLNRNFPSKSGDRTYNYYITIEKDKNNILKFWSKLSDLDNKLKELSNKTQSPISYKTHRLLDAFIAHNDSLKVYYYDSNLKQDIENVVKQWLSNNGIKQGSRTHYHGVDKPDSSGEKKSFGQLLSYEIAKQLEDNIKKNPNYTDEQWYDWIKKYTPDIIKRIQIKEITQKIIQEDESLHKWFKRKGTPGKEGGWVDCNTCRNGKCKSCGRKEGEKRAKYPSCRPTPAQCKTKGKGKKWGKTK